MSERGAISRATPGEQNTTAKHAAGTKIATLMVLASDMPPMSGVNTAPPTMAITRNDEPDFV